MKHLLKIVLRSIPWNVAILAVWDFFDDKIKAHVEKTPETWDDESLKILDRLIRDLCGDVQRKEA